MTPYRAETIKTSFIPEESYSTITFNRIENEELHQIDFDSQLERRNKSSL